MSVCAAVTSPALFVSQVMERLCVRVQQQLCLLRGAGEMEEIQAAKQVLKEARNSRAVRDTKCLYVGVYVAFSLNLNEPSAPDVSPSSTRRCASWPTCCLWTGPCGRDWTPWPANSPKPPIRSCR